MAPPSDDQEAPLVDIGGGVMGPAFVLSSDVESVAGITDLLLSPDLIVEDGTGKPDADSYVSVPDATDYLAKFGPFPEWAGADIEQQKRWLRTATRDGIDGLYYGWFRGTIEHLTQALQMPRMGLSDDDGRIINPGTNPLRVQSATALLAAALSTGEILLPDEEGSQTGALIERTESGTGIGSTTLRWSDAGGVTTSVKVRRQVEALLSPLFEKGSNTQVTRS